MTSQFLRWFLLILELVCCALCVVTCGISARSFYRLDLIRCPGESQWQIRCVRGRVIVSSFVSRNLPYDASGAQGPLYYESVIVGDQAYHRIISHLESLAGVRSHGGFAFCWDGREDEEDPLAVSTRARLFMMPLWAPILVLSVVSLVALFRRVRNRLGGSGCFEVIV
jgi:hypothetical protein